MCLKQTRTHSGCMGSAWGRGWGFYLLDRPPWRRGSHRGLCVCARACARACVFAREEFTVKNPPKQMPTRKSASPADVLFGGHLPYKCQIATHARTHVHVHTHARACPTLPLLFIFSVCGLFLLMLSRSCRTGNAEKCLDSRLSSKNIYMNI